MKPKPPRIKYPELDAGIVRILKKARETPGMTPRQLVERLVQFRETYKTTSFNYGAVCAAFIAYLRKRLTPEGDRILTRELRRLADEQNAERRRKP